METWIKVVLVSTVLLIPRLAMSGCNADEILLYEDADNWYCDTRENIAKDLKESLAALAGATSSPYCTGGDRCNFFVAKVGETRQIPYFRDVMYPRKEEDDIGGPNEYRRANEIYGFISKAVASRASGWQQVNASQVQSLADKGRFAIGVASNRDPKKSGHILVVVPSSLPKEHPSVKGGPWVRDAQSPLLSVEAGVNRFVSPDRFNKEIWAVWMGN